MFQTAVTRMFETLTATPHKAGLAVPVELGAQAEMQAPLLPTTETTQTTPRRTYHDDTTSFESVPDAVAKSVPESIAVEFGDQRVEFYLNSGECVEFNIDGRHFKFERNRR